MPWGAAIGAIGALAGGAISAGGAKDAASISAQGARDAAAEQGREFDIVQSQYAPQRQLGVGAMGLLASLYGIPNPSGAANPGGTSAPAMSGGPIMRGLPGGAGGYVFPDGSPANMSGAFSLANGGYASPRPAGAVSGNASGPGARVSVGNPTAPAASGSPDYSAFYNSPGYQFTLSQGESAINRNAAASGNLYSTNTLGALNSFAQGQAGTQYNNYVQQLLALAGLGGQAASGVSSAAVATGQGVANSMISAGNANASGVLGSSNAWGSAIGQGGNALSNYFTNPNAGGQYGGEFGSGVSTGVTYNPDMGSVYTQLGVGE